MRREPSVKKNTVSIHKFCLPGKESLWSGMARKGSSQHCKSMRGPKIISKDHGLHPEGNGELPNSGLLLLLFVVIEKQHYQVVFFNIPLTGEND